MARDFRPARKEKQWDGIPSIALLLTGSGVSIGGSFAFTSVQTVMRMIGEYVISPTSAPAALDGAKITVGIGRVSTDAFAVGASAMPDPEAEPEYPWLYRKDHVFSYAGTDPEAAGAGISLRQPFDIGAMRKFRPGESLAVVVQYTNIVGFPPLSVNVASTRILLTIH